MKKMNKKGFFFAEGLLIVLAIVALVGIGFYVKNKINKRASLAEVNCRTGERQVRLGAGPNGIKCIVVPNEQALPSVGISTVPTTELANLSTSVTANEVSSGKTPGIFCAGDGVGGNRVQAVYVHVNSPNAADVPNRASTISPIIKASAANVERIYEQSALKTGGNRHVRWVTNANCVLDIKKLSLPNLSPDTLYSAGLNQPNRKYLIYADTDYPTAPFGGLTYFSANNTVSYSNVYKSSTGIPNSIDNVDSKTAAHELMHALSSGAAGSILVDSGAPHANATAGTSTDGHCTDSYEAMCYGSGQQIICSDWLRNSTLFDCNNDDYFSTAPRAGSWLALHPASNGANSTFLSATGGPVTQKNDSWLDAISIPYTTANSTLSGNTSNATAELGEQNIAGITSRRSIWYTWKPTRSGYVTIKTYTNTSTSSVDTLLAVLKPGSTDVFSPAVGGFPLIRGLQKIYENDNYSGTSSRVRFMANAGTEYRIAIDGKNGAQGSVVLSVVPE